MQPKRTCSRFNGMYSKYERIKAMGNKNKVANREIMNVSRSVLMVTIKAEKKIK